MRLLTPPGRSLVAVTLAVTLTLLTAMQAVAHPPAETDHGVDERTFHTLWAGDEDATTKSELRSRTGESPTAMETLAAGTDIPLDAPPRAVERWNHGDLDDFPSTSATRSIHPPNASLADGRFVRDAYAAVFAVQPSTHARLSPSRSPLYVAPNGSVLGAVDYRVHVPANETTGDRRVYWRLNTHRINDTRLLVDGTVETTGNGTHTPVLDYTSLDAYVNSDPRLALVANITVTLRKRIEVCRERDDEGDCVEWDTRIEHPTETVTVADTIDVVTYDLVISGLAARYPNGDLGLLLYKNKPWLGYSLPGGGVRGVWRFYAARNAAWDTLVTSTATGTERRHSPLHPLQVHAYPIEPGATPDTRRTVAILEAFGPRRQSPTLPDRVNLDVLNRSYTASYGLATRAETSQELSAVAIHGLVRGVGVNGANATIVDTPLRESRLTLTVVNTTNATVTVRVDLRDARTGAPIATTGRGGAVVVAGERLNTTSNGSVTTTLPRSTGTITARYDPGRWWRHRPAYVADTDVVHTRGTVLRALGTLYRLAVPVALFGLAVFIIDRVTGWGIWPPWRGV